MQAEFSTLSAEWREQKGTRQKALAAQGGYADLVVVSQSDPDMRLFPGDRDMPNSLILSAARLVLVLPFGYAGDFPCRCILIAWDGGPVAAGAVHDALPILQNAGAVSALVVNPGELSHDWPAPAVDVAAHLARHGVKVEADHVTSADLEAADILLSRAVEMQADLIVMGACGHARWSELILGGVTNLILGHQTVPVVMSH
ncbi:MAG: universal stress protein [Rhodospirillaceae bacterium]